MFESKWHLKRILPVLAAAAILIAACTPAGVVSPTSTPITQPPAATAQPAMPTAAPVVGATHVPTSAGQVPDQPLTPEPAGGTSGGRTYPEAILKAIGVLSAAQNVPTADIRVVSMDEVQWPNACLGVASPGKLCADVVTPGYRVVLSAGEAEYVFHTNLDGTLIERALG